MSSRYRNRMAQLKFKLLEKEKKLHLLILEHSIHHSTAKYHHGIKIQIQNGSSIGLINVEKAQKTNYCKESCKLNNEWMLDIKVTALILNNLCFEPRCQYQLEELTLRPLVSATNSFTSLHRITREDHSLLPICSHIFMSQDSLDTFIEMGAVFKHH